MTFDIKIQDGRFFVSYCASCEKVVWPPSEFCNRCFLSSMPKDISPFGTLLEFSKKNEEYFGLAEFDEKVRLIGRIQGVNTPKEGMRVRLEKCNFHNDQYHFEMNFAV